MKTRRGLSTVVGMIFSIIALTSTVAYVSYSMNTLNNYNQAVLVSSQQNINLGKEKFQVSNVALVNNKFNITVVNTGNIPINFTKIWIQNTTAVDWVHGYVPPSNIVAPGGILKNIGQNIPVSALSSKSYSIKLVTSRGNAYQFYVNSPNLTPIPLQVIAAPGSVPTGFQTSLILTATNNMTNNAALTNVSPGPLNILSNNGVTSNCIGPTPASYASIPVGTTAMFQWICTVSGNVGSSITYNATLQNGYNHNYALSTITIGNVQFAAQSASAVSAQGFSAPTATTTTLLFDQNHFAVPYGGYEMYNEQPNNSTNNPNTDTFVQVDQNKTSYYTNNATALTISPGKWNATLRYISAPVPSTFSSSQYPDVVYHFENTFNSLGNSMNNKATLATHGSPTWASNTGVNNTAAYTFSSNYLDTSVTSGYNDVPSGSTKVNTAMWFKSTASGSCAASCTLFKIGDSSTAAHYDVYILNHVMVFKFSDHNNNNSHGGQTDATCTGVKTVDDAKWHHVIVEKTGSTSCKIYVDGASDGNSVAGIACSGGGGGDCSTVSTSYHVDIGRNQTSGSNYFNGVIDDVIHWNGNWNNNLSQSQVTDLFKTSYGANAHIANFYIFETDQIGNCPSGGTGAINGNCQDKLVQSLNYQLPFMDGWYYSSGTVSYSSPSASSTTWGHYNYTATLGQVTVSSTQRIDFQALYPSQTNGKLGMKMIVDNTGLSDQWGQSLLQTPQVSAPFVGYYSYMAHSNGNDQDGQVYVYNPGPDIAWVEQGSRVIFMSFDKSSAYAGWLFFLQGGGGTQSRGDSASIAVGTSNMIFFSTPYTQPGLDGYQRGTTIPDGMYQMYVYVNGYDEEGHTMLGAQNMGVVRVYSK